MVLFSSKSTYNVLFRFVIFFILLSFLVRGSLLFASMGNAELSLLALARIFLLGLVFDIGVASFITLPYALYLLFLPRKWNNSIINKVITYFFFSLVVLVLIFTFFAEFTFWKEFESRFNFIAVDYLIYTYEVINNINESYPLPILISAVLLISFSIVWFFQKKQYFAQTFTGTTPFIQRLFLSFSIFFIVCLYSFTVNNSLAETGNNRYQNELSKAGIYSFFAAFKNNELSYDDFYKQVDNKQAFAIMKKQLADSASVFSNNPFALTRTISSSGELHPNVIMITIESFSADFMEHFGNLQHLTPVLDSLADKSILFTEMYATGTRTVRGMEALSLAVPPTPGSSIVRRPNNNNLTTVGSIFKAAGYETGFFYGGDGYFDNMNQFFGSNGYAVTDRGSSRMKSDDFTATRTIISDSAVQFENAWGICDGDLYDAVASDADAKFKMGKPFYDFVMTTSNHRPYTYPSGKIDIPSGSSREGAVKYTDFAIGAFLNKIKLKPWFANTVFIFVADHCASSAGKNEIDIAKYHIPAIIYNLPKMQASEAASVCSQIDLYPTLFHLLHWTYSSNLYGQDVLSKKYQPRILLGTYQKLAYMKNDDLVVLSPQQKVETYKYSKATNQQIPMQPNAAVVAEAIAAYQSAYFLFKHDGLKQKPIKSHL